MALAAIGLGIQTFGAIQGLVQGRANTKAAEKGLDEFQYPQLTNLAAGLSPSLKAEELARDRASKILASGVDVAAGRGLADALAITSMSAESSSDLYLKSLSSQMDKEFEADKIRLMEDQQIRQMQEARSSEELQSLKQQALAGQQMQYDALSDVASLAVSADLGQGAKDAARLLERDKVRAKRREERLARVAAGEGTGIGNFFRGIKSGFAGFFSGNQEE